MPRGQPPRDARIEPRSAGVPEALRTTARRYRYEYEAPSLAASSARIPCKASPNPQALAAQSAGSDWSSGAGARTRESRACGCGVSLHAGSRAREKLCKINASHMQRGFDRSAVETSVGGSVTRSPVIGVSP